MPGEYKEYLHLTQTTKSASIAFIALTGNVSASFTHSFGPWILDFEASYHISSNKDLFSSLTFSSALLTITLANGSQTIAKGIGLACPLPSLPLTSIFYVPDFPFNLISIHKLTLDLHCLLTFYHNSVNLQDWSTGMTISMGHESQCLFHLRLPLCSIACTSTNNIYMIRRKSSLMISELGLAGGKSLSHPSTI